MILSSFTEGNFIVSVFDSLDKEVSRKWDENKTPHLRSDYLQFIQECRPVDLTFRYIIIEKKTGTDTVLAGVIYFQDLRFTGKNISTSNKLLSFLLSALFKIISYRISICGNLFAVDFPALWINESEICMEDILSIIFQSQRKLKKDIIILKDLVGNLNTSILNRFDLKPYPSDLTMALKINNDWSNFEDYVKALTKKYRKRADKIIATGLPMVRKDLSEEDIKMEQKIIGQLFKNVSSRQSIRMGIIGVNYFVKFKREYSEGFSFEGYYVDNKMIGFATYLEHGDTLEMHYIGMDYKFNNEYNIYFNMLFDGVKHAIEKKKKLLELGRTAREAKASLGAQAVYFNDYIFIKGGFTRFLVNKLGNDFNNQMGGEWRDRMPFKDS